MGGWEGREGGRTWGQPCDQEWTCVYACLHTAFLSLHARGHTFWCTSWATVHRQRQVHADRRAHTEESSLNSPEPRKGYVSSLSLSPSGPAATVPRSNRDVPLPESGKRGNRDWMAWATKKWRKKKETTLLSLFIPCVSFRSVGGAVWCRVKSHDRRWPLQSVTQTAPESQQGQDKRSAMGRGLSQGREEDAEAQGVKGRNLQSGREPGG